MRNYLNINSDKEKIQISLKLQKGELRFSQGNLQIYAVGRMDLMNIRKILNQLEIKHKYERIEHILNIPCSQNVLRNYDIFISDTEL